MAETYNIVLVSIGNRKDQILEYIKNSTNYGHEEATMLLEKLPVVLRKTTNRFEAKIIKEALQLLGADVEIQRQGSSSSSQQSSRQRSQPSQRSYPETQISESSHASPIQDNSLLNRGAAYSNYNSNLEPASPIKESKGCALVIIVGALIFFSVSICFSYILL